MSEPDARVILTPDQRLRVFVSSTLQELAPERSAAREAIAGLQLIPVMFELGARPHPPQALYRAYLAQSQLFVGVYWQSYGWVAPDASISGVHEEYELAAGMPRLLYVKEPAPERETRLGDFLERIIEEGSLSFRPFETAAELGELLVQDLALLLTERFHVGTKAPPAPRTGFIGRDVELAQLRARRHLPAPQTPLVGRGSEVAELAELLRSGVRLVTLTGAGGIGKTRLALGVGDELADAFADGVYFVGLSDLTDPELVPTAIARGLGLSMQRNEPPDAAVEAYLAGREILLLLDNFEVVDAAAPLVSRLLRAAPELVVLATSRTSLRLSGEHQYRVEPLSLADARRLFVARAGAVAPSFRRPTEESDEVARLCERLDCLPLAIELAAARTRDYAPHELLDSVGGSLALAGEGARDLPSRQRTLRSTIDWSYRLLAAEEQALFTRLAVFAGGFAGRSAAAVCDAGRETLAALVGASLVQERAGAGAEARYFMLETVREYALELLAESGEGETWRRRHAEHYALLAEAVEDEHPGSRSGAAWQGLEAEQDNFRAALDWSRDSGASDLHLRLVGALAYFWATSDHLREGNARVGAALRRADDADTPLRAKLLAGSAHVAHSIGDYERTRASAQASLDLFRTLGDERGTALAVNLLGIAHSNLGDIDGGISCLEESAAISRRIGDGVRLSAAINNLGYCLLRRGQYDRARAQFEEGLAVSRAAGHRVAESVMLGNLGLAALLERRPAEALGLFRRALVIDRQLGFIEGMIYGLVGIAAGLSRTGEASDAVMLIGAADSAARDTAVELEPLELEVHAQVREELEEALGAQRFARIRASGQALSLNEAVEQALRIAESRAPASSQVEP